jgi:GNAT superfamily N-acetyltransferase
VTGAPPSGPQVTVRRATAADADTVVAMLVEVAGEGRWIATEAPVDVEQRRRRLVEDIEREDAIVLVAEAGGQPVGELGLHLARYGVADLGMAVAAGWRGRGIGSALLAEASTRPARPAPTRSPSRSGPTTPPPSPSMSASASGARAT